ncbi:hypothetical protein G7Z17_g222 [Cylindrodendrum hubeiense]|uniref:Uncharacterized protein n=1 Tax=Cylindrodendrum hubeiense TaxID=595255 RepID=A0A9P5LDJ1_9HYPO|nr:hypothetical protein G7Z17_g222 [Cylindrodendrum hubeiense]
MRTIETERAMSLQLPFEDEPFQIVIDGLMGCTAIVIASNRAVWMTHLWETYSNGKPVYTNEVEYRQDSLSTEEDEEFYTWMTDQEAISEDPDDEYRDNRKSYKAFEDRVLSFLKGETVPTPRTKNSKGAYLRPRGPGITPDLFDNPQIWLVVPMAVDIAGTKTVTIKGKNTIVTGEGKGEKFTYEKRVMERIAPLIMERLGVDEMSIVGYARLRENIPSHAKLLQEERGRVLFQYDPDSDGNGQKGWRVFIESLYSRFSV